MSQRIKPRSKIGSGDTANLTPKSSKNKQTKVQVRRNKIPSPRLHNEVSEVTEGQESVPKEDENPFGALFQQIKAINELHACLKLRRKEEEEVAKSEWKAALTIQTTWRGFITRYNLKILHQAAKKIQAVIRGFVARRNVGRLCKKREEMRRQVKLQESATKIQSVWRGHHSRKNKFNFKEYQKIQQKNSNLKKSIESINKLESTLVNRKSRVSSLRVTTMSEDQLRKSYSNFIVTQHDHGDDSSSLGSISQASLSSKQTREKSSTVEIRQYLQENFPDLANMSSYRISELYAYAKSTFKKASQDSKKVSQNSLKKLKTIQKSDSLDNLFPDFPEIEGLIKPDPAKVEALKQAIRLLQQQIQANEEKELQRSHYLLRTSSSAGVFSDPFCSELTEIEKQLKTVKFYSPPPDPRFKRKKIQEMSRDESLFKSTSEQKVMPLGR